MKKATLTIIGFLLIFSGFSQLETQLQSVFQNNNLMGMSVWVYCQGQEHQFHFGLRDNTRQLAMDENSKYRIASISKTFTALGLMKLNEQGLFDLDDNISDYMGYEIKNPNHPNVPITFRMLLSHRASLQDGSGYNGFLSATFSQNPVPNISQLLIPGGANYTANMWRQETPGTYFAYSNATFGLIGTLIEKISGQRFDLFMQEQILNPLGITGSYNVTLLPDIDDVAVIYRNQSGWTPQVDNYQGVMPSPMNLDGYVPGTNGLLFGPQGSLRASAAELGKMLKLFISEGQSPEGLFTSETLAAMRVIEWNYSGNNGDNYYGLFNRWGLGMHHANTIADDQICLNQGWGTFIGHPGEAYGLVSDAYFNEENEVAVVFMHNGIFGGHQNGTQSIYYTVEEDIFNTVCTYWSDCANSIAENELFTWEVFPNPAADGIYTLRFFSGHAGSAQITLVDATGKEIMTKAVFGTNAVVDLSDNPSGLYVLSVQTEAGLKSVKLVR